MQSCQSKFREIQRHRDLEIRGTAMGVLPTMHDPRRGEAWAFGPHGVGTQCQARGGLKNLALSTDHAVNCLEHSRRSLFAEHCRTLLQHRHISKEASREQQDFKRLDRSGLANTTASQQQANWLKARATRSHAASPPAVGCDLRRCASHFGNETVE